MRRRKKGRRFDSHRPFAESHHDVDRHGEEHFKEIEHRIVDMCATLKQQRQLRVPKRHFEKGYHCSLFVPSLSWQIVDFLEEYKR
jgi:hypothetical protein